MQKRAAEERPLVAQKRSFVHKQHPVTDKS